MRCDLCDIEIPEQQHHKVNGKIYCERCAAHVQSQIGHEPSGHKGEFLATTQVQELFRIIGIITIVVGFVAGVLVGVGPGVPTSEYHYIADPYPPRWLYVILVTVPSFISGLVFIGFSEVIGLLDRLFSPNVVVVISINSRSGNFPGIRTFRGSLNTDVFLSARADNCSGTRQESPSIIQNRSPLRAAESP